MLQAPSLDQAPHQAALLFSNPLARAAPEMGAESRTPISDPLPPPPSEMPPPPPPTNSEFEVSPFSDVHEWTGSFPQQPQYKSRQSGPSGPPATVTPGGPPPPPPVAPGVWGMGGLGGSNSPGGSWAPLSTSPGGGLPGGLSTGNLGANGMASWLSTGVSECDGTAVPVNSTAMSHAAGGGCSSASSSHISYSMQPAPTSDASLPPGLWSASSPTATSVTSSAVTPALMPASMPSVMQSVSLPMFTSAMQMEKNGYRNQLRAEAAPYVPLNMGVGVQAC